MGVTFISVEVAPDSNREVVHMAIDLQLMANSYKQNNFIDDEQYDKLQFLAYVNEQYQFDEDNLVQMFLRVVEGLPSFVYVANYNQLFGNDGCYEYRKKLAALFNDVFDVRVLKYFYDFCTEMLRQ